MSLAIITPTRRRWYWLLKQAAALAGQLAPDDRWLIAIDNDEPDTRYVDRIRELIGDKLIVWLQLAYERPDPPHGVVNRLRNAAVAFSDPEADIVELDDHDVLERDALSELRHALAAGNDFVFGWHRTDCLIEAPTGELLLEKWPDYRPQYTRDSFARQECQPCGVRAIGRSLWNRLVGWNPATWPEGNMDFCLRAEEAGAAICCLQKTLCAVLIDPDGISVRYRRSPRLEPVQAE